MVKEKMKVVSSVIGLTSALNTVNVGEVLLALQSIDAEFNTQMSQQAIVNSIHEVATWDLSENPETSANVVTHLYGMLSDEVTKKQVCKAILVAQPAVAVQLVVRIMMENHWTLGFDGCKSVYDKLKSLPIPSQLDATKSEEFALRTAANCTILRVSGTPKRYLKKLLLDRLKPLTTLQMRLPYELLNELSIYCPYHPFTVVEDSRIGSTSFLIPRVHSLLHRFHSEVDQFVEYLQPGSAYKNENARQMLNVFHSIFEIVEHLEEFGAEEIGRLVNFWIAVLRVFEGSGISMKDITETGKLVEKTAKKFQTNRRPLFLKHFLKTICATKDSNIMMEPQVAGLVISTFQRIVFRDRIPAMYEELGDFWTVVLEMKYSDVYKATSYFSAVFSLAHAQAQFRVKEELCRAVYEKILKPMYEQIIDFKKLKRVEDEKAITVEQRMIIEQDNIGSGEFSILVCTHEIAEKSILKFINE